jgi:hypothetical protein
VSDADVLAELRELEVLRRRLAVADHALIGELDRRGLPARLVMSSTSALLQGLLRLSPGQARERVTAARACGPRTALTGQPLPPHLPGLAAAQADGAVSAEHTRIILTTLHQLPATVSAEDRALAEKHLVEAATTLRPRQVAAVGTRILAHLHPHPHRRRPATPPQLHPAPRTRRQLHRPRPAHPHLRRPTARLPHSPLSTPAQRRGRPGPAHLRPTNARRVARPRPISRPPQRPDRVRRARPGHHHHGRRPTHHPPRTRPHQLRPPAQHRQALKLADEAAINLLLTDATGAVLNHHRTKRIATRTQTLALIARDKGCTFPGCDTPPEWCQRHHITAWADGGTTNLNNLTLICGYHHREFQRADWTCRMHNGHPHWTPPTWIDPTQTPQRNHIHRQ